MSSPPPKLTTWSRATARQPFDAAEHNRLVTFANGELAAPQTWVADDGSVGLDWDPATPKLTIGAELAAEGDLTIEGDLVVEGTLAVDGEATFDGPMTLGDLPADSIHIKGTLLLDVPIVLPPGSTGPAPPNNSVTSATIVDGAIVNADVNASAAIALSKLAAGAAGFVKSNGTTITAGNVLAATDLPADSITATQLAGDSVGASELADNSVADANVIAGAAIQLSKLAPGASGFVKSNGTVITAGNALSATDIPADTITATQLAPDSVGASELADNSVADANVIAGAAIAVTKLAHVGAGNVLKSTGTANVGGQVTNADVSASAAIAKSKLAALDIVNADVNAAAAIALSKLAAGAAGVLKSNGTAITAGNQIVAADITTDTITASQLAADCVGASELADGAVATANIIDATVTTAKLAANVATQATLATPTTNNPATSASSSATAVLLSECSVSPTTAGGPVLAWFSGTFIHSVAGAVVAVELRLDSVVYQTRSVLIGSAGGRAEVSLFAAIPPASVPIGGHTLAIYMWSPSGATLTANALDRAFGVLELRR